MRTISLIVGVLAGCRLDPLVGDEPGASVHLLPAGAEVPSVADDLNLTTQIALNDGLDDRALMMSGGVIARGTGWVGGVQIPTWSFGPTSRVPAPVYVFYRRDGEVLTRIPHPYLLSAMPGEASYRAIMTVQQVVVTDAYAGELITSLQALADARELGLIEEPVAAGMFFNGPVVQPGLVLDVGGAQPAQPFEAYASGYRVQMFQLGGMLGIQPLTSYAPTMQVAYLREAMKATYDSSRPIFQATVPTAAPTMKANYTPVTVVVNVDLAPGVMASSITGDADLFTRNAMTGAISGTTANVATFATTMTTLDLQLQFTVGVP